MRDVPNRPGGLRALWSSMLAILLVGMTQLVQADSEYAAAWGPSVGASVPLLAATDQDGNEQSLDTLKGSNGLLFVFNRSVDW